MIKFLLVSVFLFSDSVIATDEYRVMFKCKSFQSSLVRSEKFSFTTNGYIEDQKDFKGTYRKGAKTYKYILKPLSTDIENEIPGVHIFEWAIEGSSESDNSDYILTLIYDTDSGEKVAIGNLSGEEEGFLFKCKVKLI